MSEAEKKPHDEGQEEEDQEEEDEDEDGNGGQEEERPRLRSVYPGKVLYQKISGEMVPFKVWWGCWFDYHKEFNKTMHRMYYDVRSEDEE